MVKNALPFQVQAVWFWVRRSLGKFVILLVALVVEPALSLLVAKGPLTDNALIHPSLLGSSLVTTAVQEKAPQSVVVLSQTITSWHWVVPVGQDLREGLLALGVYGSGSVIHSDQTVGRA